MLIEHLRTHIRCSFFSSPSDLMKSTVVDESLSTTTTRVLFQGEIIYLLHNDSFNCHILIMHTQFVNIFSIVWSYDLTAQHTCKTLKKSIADTYKLLHFH